MSKIKNADEDFFRKKSKIEVGSMVQRNPEKKKWNGCIIFFGFFRATYLEIRIYYPNIG
jgi:hypothetical protein